MPVSVLRIFLLLLWFSLLASACNLVPLRGGWLQELNRNLSGYYLVWQLVALGLLAALWQRVGRRERRLAAAVLVALSAVYGARVLDFYLPPPAEVENSARVASSFRLLLANVSLHDSHHGRLRALIDEHNPDVIGLVEVDRAWLRGLQLGSGYPFAREMPRGDHFGLALYSRFPLEEPAVESLGEDVPPVIITSLQPRPGRRIELALLHAVPPVTSDGWRDNYLTHRRLMTRFKHSRGDLIVVGDFNATPFSGALKGLIFHGRLREAAAGFGWRRTWHAQHWWLRLPIDHVLYRGALTVRGFQVLPDFGSNHFPLLAEFGY